MIYRLLLILVWVFPTAAAAQLIPVRSGEHTDFTRLVFDLPVDLDWSVTSNPDQQFVDLTFAKEGLAFDISQTFQRIARDRIAAVKPADSGSKVRIDFACQCRAEVFMASERMLVVDVRSSLPDRTTVEKSAEQAVPSSPLSALRLDDAPRIGPAKRATPQVAEFETDDRLFDEIQAGTASRQTELLSAEILRDVADAANLGLLNSAAQPIELLPNQAQGQIDPKPPAKIEQTTEDFSGSFADVNKRVAEHGVVSIGGFQCTDQDALNIGTWTNDDDVSLAVAKGRAELFQEFDRVSPDAIVTLAKTMLHFGLGAEARAVLSISPAEPPRILMALSFLVDGETDEAGYFGGQLECQGPAALWALLSASEPIDQNIVDIQAVARSFEELPLHLRELLGPELAARYTQAGATSAAKDILRRLERALGGPNDETVFASASVAAAKGELEDAHTDFMELAENPGPKAAPALVKAVEIAQERDLPMDGGLVELSAAFAKELELTEDGPNLWQAHIRALLASQQFEEAITTLAEPPENAEAQSASAAIEVISAAIHDTTDSVFLQLALSGAIPKTQADSGRFVHSIAKRLLSLGIADHALTQLQSLKAAESDPETTFLKAKALLALGRPEEAEILLIGRQDALAMDLRAQARSRMGDHAHASSLYDLIGAQDQHQRAARMAGQWRGLDAERYRNLVRAAELKVVKPADLDVSYVSLAMAETLMKQSATVRATLRELLVETQID